MKRIALMFASLLALPIACLAAPTASLTSVVGAGNVPTLNWSCGGDAVAAVATGDWMGSKALSGSQTLPAIAATSNYAITCTSAADTSATLSWTAPTQNTDGSALTDLAGFRVYAGTAANALTQSQQIASPATLTYQLTGLSVATHFFAVTAYNAQGAESILSNVATKLISTAQSANASVKINVPKAPGLTVVDSAAFNLKLKGLRLVLNRQVGKVSLGTSCTKGILLPAGYALVNRSAVAFSSRDNSMVIVAKCA